MICVAFLAILAAVHGAAVEKRSLTSMDQTSLDGFTKMFRTTLLDQVAGKWDATMTLTNTLKTKMTACNTTINNQVTSCKSCTSTTCQSSPTFLDYLALANPMTFLVGPLKDLSSKFGEVSSLLGTEATSFFHSMKSIAGSATALGTSFTHAMTAAEKELSSLSTGLNNVGHEVGGSISNVGHAIGHAGHSIGHALHHVFGKRELDSQTVECLKKCDSCHALLLSKDKMVAQLCGADIVTMNNTITASVHKVKQVYDAALDKTHPIITKLEFDMASSNAKMQLTKVFLTVHLNGQVVRYQTAVPYAMMQLPQTAHDIAMEYWNKAL